MIRNIIVLLLIVVGTALNSGCQKKGVVRPEGMKPFGPVQVTFAGLRKDVSVEKEIEKRLFCQDCLFLRANTTQTSYSLTVYYDRRMDLKSLGFVVLSAALAPVEAEFTYTLQVEVLESDKVLKDYVYREQTIEKTDSAYGSMFNPFHDTNGRSEEIFTELTDRFLREIQIDRLILPKFQSPDS